MLVTEINDKRTNEPHLPEGLSDKSILVVDDNTDIAITITLSLQMYGFNVVTFTNPFQALQDFHENSGLYCLVLSDIQMPGMTGFEFVEKLSEVNPHIKILLMTASDIDPNESSKVSHPPTNVDGYIRKPVTMENLNNEVHRHLDEIGTITINA